MQLIYIILYNVKYLIKTSYAKTIFTFSTLAFMK